MHDTTCGGVTEDGTTALSVYRLAGDDSGSTPPPTTTRRSTGHSSPVSGITDSTCPDNGKQVDDSCYSVEAVNGNFKPGMFAAACDHLTYTRGCTTGRPPIA